MNCKIMQPHIQPCQPSWASVVALEAENQMVLGSYHSESHVPFLLDDDLRMATWCLERNFMLWYSLRMNNV